MDNKELLNEEMENESTTYKQEAYEKECKRFKFKAVCTLLSLAATVAFLLVMAYDGKETPLIIDGLIAVFGFLGWIATLISNPIIVLKSILKITITVYSLVPFFLFDILVAVLAFGAALYIAIIAPVIYCLYGLYLAYERKEAMKLYV